MPGVKFSLSLRGRSARIRYKGSLLQLERDGEGLYRSGFNQRRPTPSRSRFKGHTGLKESEGEQVLNLSVSPDDWESSLQVVSVKVNELWSLSVNVMLLAKYWRTHSQYFTEDTAAIVPNKYLCHDAAICTKMSQF